MSKAETALANAPWPKAEEPLPKPRKRKRLPNGESLDTKFKEWATKNKVDLQDIPMMKGNRK